MSEIIIREYSPVDSSAVERCIFELQEDEYKRRPHYWASPTQEVAKTYLNYTLDAVKKEENSKKIIVGVMDEVIIGWVVVHITPDDTPDVALKKYGYVSELTVLRKFQKKGAGAALMAKAEEFIKSQGLEWMELNVSTGNQALDFYHKLGYKENSIRLEKRLI